MRILCSKRAVTSAFSSGKSILAVINTSPCGNCLSLRRPARNFSSFNLARVQHFEFIGISLTHKLKRVHCLPRLRLVDLAHGKAHVNQYPISRADSLWPHQRPTHIAFHARDIYFGNGICVVHDVYDLTWYTKTHMLLLYRTVVDAMNRALTFFAIGQPLLLADQDLCRHHWVARAG